MEQRRENNKGKREKRRCEREKRVLVKSQGRRGGKCECEEEAKQETQESHIRKNVKGRKKGWSDRGEEVEGWSHGIGWMNGEMDLGGQAAQERSN